MTNLDLLGIGIRNLWRRKLRTFLTVLGVIIGAASIMIMISFGLAISESNAAMLARMGDVTTLTIHPADNFGGGMMFGNREPEPVQKPSEKKLLDKSAVATITKLPHVKVVSPVISINGNLKYKKSFTWVQIMGIDEKAMEDFGIKAVKGRNLLAGESKKGLVGNWVPMGFYDPSQAYGKGSNEIDVLDTKFELILSDYVDMGPSSPFDLETPQNKLTPPSVKIDVVGILSENNYEYGSALVMPMKEVEKFKKEQDAFNKKLSAQQSEEGNQFPMGQTRRSKDTYTKILVKVDNIQNVEALQNMLKAEGFQVSSMLDMSNELAGQTRTLQLILGGIGAVSLLVAAIGIMNTMVMSIYERTKEIGVMKVIGASIGNIRNMFLLEASMIGLMGGIFGVGLSLVASYFINQAAANSGMFGGGGGPDAIVPKLSVIPFWLILLALLFSMAIGVISGYYPAVRATRLSALEAMRAE